MAKPAPYAQEMYGGFGLLLLRALVANASDDEAAQTAKASAEQAREGAGVNDRLRPKQIIDSEAPKRFTPCISARPAAVAHRPQKIPAGTLARLYADVSMPAHVPT